MESTVKDNIPNRIRFDDYGKPGQQKRRERRARNKKRVKNKPLASESTMVIGENHLIHLAIKNQF